MQIFDENRNPDPQQPRSRTAGVARQSPIVEKVAISPRAALAFSGLAVFDWIRSKFVGLARLIMIGRARPQVAKREEKECTEKTIYVVKSVIHFAILALFSLSCSMLRAQEAASSAAVPRLVNFSGRAADSPSASRTSDEETLRQLNEKLLTAHDKADVKTLDEIEANDFTLAGEFGLVTKQQHLDHVRNATSIMGAVNRQITPQQIRIYGDVALVTETDHASGSGGMSEYQTTSVWVRKGDGWKIEHMHYSKLIKD